MTSHGKGTNDERSRNEEFVRDVLARTSGSACDRACGQLSDLMAGVLESMDRELVQAHLEHCDPCRSVAVTLGWMEPLLPAMAEIDPGPAFTARVVARTTGRARVQVPLSMAPTGPAGLMDRVGGWWERQILRPGFAAQMAYAATLILVLLTSVPGAPLKGVPGKALEIVQAGPTVAPVVGPALDLASGWIGGRTSAAVDATRANVDRRLEQTGSALGQRGDRTAPGRRKLGTHVKGMVSKVGDGKLGEASYEFLAVLKAGRMIWIEWWKDSDDNGQE
jgi:hypothetical protein